MGNKRVGLAVIGLLLLVLLAPASQAHEQKTLSVILTEDGVVSGNITDPSFLQGNAVSVSYTHLTLPTICSV